MHNAQLRHVILSEGEAVVEGSHGFDRNFISSGGPSAVLGATIKIIGEANTTIMHCAL